MIAVLGASAVHACKVTTPMSSEPTRGSCGAAELQHLVGQTYIESTLTAQPSLRVIRPGIAVTMDINEARLNIELDVSDTILRVWCG